VLAGGLVGQLASLRGEVAPLVGPCSDYATLLREIQQVRRILRRRRLESYVVHLRDVAAAASRAEIFLVNHRLDCDCTSSGWRIHASKLGLSRSRHVTKQRLDSKHVPECAVIFSLPTTAVCMCLCIAHGVHSHQSCL
jgi:hypothetical protein